MSPDAQGNFKGVAVPKVPWHDDEPSSPGETDAPEPPSPDARKDSECSD